ncbi:MAG TPA: GNAT family protein [Brevundimonas sp.]|nr:GNAT family protein [Brevundimonas sp.]
MELLTARLKLRSARPEDVEALHAVLSDPVATRWWSTPPHETLDQTAAWLETMIAGGPEQPDFVIEMGGRVVGKAGFFKLPEIGYILHPDVWGQGVATEAVAAAVDHVFAEHHVDRLTADVDPENIASIRLLERLGFVMTGSAERTWCIGGAWKDSLYYALTREARVRASGAHARA